MNTQQARTPARRLLPSTATAIHCVRQLALFEVCKDAEWSLSFDQEGDGAVAMDPRPLRFPDEPMLDAVCDGVLRLGVRKGRIQITQSTTLGVDGELGVRLKKAGFKLGVGGAKATVTDFVIEAAFAPEVSKELDEIVAKTEPTSARSLLASLRARRSGHSTTD